MSEDDRTPHVGEAVVYVDESRRSHHALVTAVWGATCINLLFVSGDETKQDDYGRQIERESSATHCSAFERNVGNFWHFADEDAPIDGGAPQEV